MSQSNALVRSILYATSTFYMKGISLFMVPFVVHYLKVEEYGRLEFIGSFAIFLSVIVGFGLEDTLYRFSGKQKDKVSANTVAAQIYGLVIIVSALFLVSSLVILFIFHEYINAPFQLCLILALTLSLEGVIAVPLGWMRMNDHFKLYCSINIVRATLQACLTIAALSLNRGVEGIFEVGLITTLFTAIICLVYQVRSSGISYKNKNSISYVRYAVPIVASGFLAFLLNGFDKWVLADSSSLSELGFYAVTGKFAIALTIAMQPYGMWWSPSRFALLNTRDGVQDVSKFAVYGLLQIAFFSLVIGITAPILIAYLFSSEFQVCIVLIAPLLAVFATKESTEFLNIGCFSSDSTATQLKITLGSTIIGVVGMFFLTPIFGLKGLIASLLLAQLCRTLSMYVFSQRVVRLTIPYYKIASLYLITFLNIVVVNNLLAQELLNKPTLLEVLTQFSGIWLVVIIEFIALLTLLFYRHLPLHVITGYVKTLYKQGANRLSGLAL